MDEGSKDPVAPNGKPPEVIGVQINEQTIPLMAGAYTCPVRTGGTNIEVLVSIPDYVAVGMSAEIVEGGVG
jgi:hypothetical protein